MLTDLITIPYFQTSYSISASSFQKFLDGGHFNLCCSSHHGACPLNIQIQLILKVMIKCVALYIHFGLQRTRLCVKACMKNCTIGLGGTSSYVRLFFQQDTFKIVFCQLVKNRTACDAAANDDNICFLTHSTLSLYKIKQLLRLPKEAVSQ